MEVMLLFNFEKNPLLALATCIKISTIGLISIFVYIVMQRSQGWQDSYHIYGSSIDQCTRLLLAILSPWWGLPLWDLFLQSMYWVASNWPLLSSLSASLYVTWWESSHSPIMVGAYEVHATFSNVGRLFFLSSFWGGNISLQRLYDFDGCWMILAFLVMLSHLFPMIIQESYKLSMILYMKHERKNHISVDAFFTLSQCHQKTIYI